MISNFLQRVNTARLSYTTLKNDISSRTKGSMLKYMIIVSLFSILFLFLNLMASGMIFANKDNLMLINIGFSSLILLINNQIFYYFLRQSRKVSINSTHKYSDTLLQQVACGFLLSILQSYLLSFLSQVLQNLFMLNIFVSILIKFIFLLWNGSIALYILDKNDGIIDSIKHGFLILKSNILSIFELSSLYVFWMFLFELVISTYLVPYIKNTPSNLHIIHSLLQKLLYQQALYVLIIYVVSFVITSYFQVRAFIGIGLLYMQTEDKLTKKNRKKRSK